MLSTRDTRLFDWELSCNWETKRANALQRRAKDPDFEYKPWMDRPDDYIGGKAP